jgi:hypothetical protein
MAHLSPGQFVDLVEGAAPAEHAAHAASCERCRAQADALREVLRQAAADTVPEPSPLFWKHMAARVGAAVRREPAPVPARTFWTWRRASVAAVAAKLVLAAGLGTHMRKTPSRGAPVATGPPASSVVVSAPGATEEELLPLDDPSWNLMTELSADVVFDDERSAEIPAVPGLADLALQQLSEPERAELAKILREELMRPPGADPKTAGVSSAP